MHRSRRLRESPTPVGRLVAATLVLVFVLAGCGGDDDDQSPSASGDGGAEATTDDGDGGDGAAGATDDTTSGGGSEDRAALADFAVPAPDGAEIVAVLPDVVAQIRYPVSRFDELVAFYDDWAASTGLETEGVVRSGDTQASLVVRGTDVVYAVTMVVGDGSDTVLVNIAINP